MNQKDLLIFNKQSPVNLQKLVSKFLEKSSIKYKFVSAVRVCDPKNFGDNKSICFEWLKTVNEVFWDQKRLSSVTCEKIDWQFKTLVNENDFPDKAKIFLINKKSTKIMTRRLLDYLMKDDTEEYYKLRKLFQMIFDFP